MTGRPVACRPPRARSRAGVLAAGRAACASSRWPAARYRAGRSDTPPRLRDQPRFVRRCSRHRRGRGRVRPVSPAGSQQRAGAARNRPEGESNGPQADALVPRRRRACRHPVRRDLHAEPGHHRVQLPSGGEVAGSRPAPLSPPLRLLTSAARPGASSGGAPGSGGASTEPRSTVRPCRPRRQGGGRGTR